MSVNTLKKRIKEKQINSVRSALLLAGGFSFVAGATADVTTPITTLLASGGRSGVAVTLKTRANDNDDGVVVGDICEVRDTNNDPILSPVTGNEIYGRITEAGGVYTLSLYESVSGIETVYTAPATFDCNFSVAYTFQFKDYPVDGGWKTKSKIVQDDAKAKAGMWQEALTVIALNTLSSTTKSVSDTTRVKLSINGQNIYSNSTTPAFTIDNAGAITWNAVNANYDLETDDVVEVEYPTVQ